MYLNDGFDDLEKIYDDHKSWAYFDGEEGETVGVYRRCQECGRFLTKGKLFMNLLGHIRLAEWYCKAHGEVKPYFDRNINDLC